MWAFSLLIAKTKNVKNKVDLSQELITISKNLEKGGNESWFMCEIISLKKYINNQRTELFMKGRG